MLILPAIDLPHGKCVRLYPGRAGPADGLFDHPAEISPKLAGGRGRATCTWWTWTGPLPEKCKTCGPLKISWPPWTYPCQLGGGIRDLAAIKQLCWTGHRPGDPGDGGAVNPELVAEACQQFGAERIVLGPGRHRDGRVAIRGWQETAGVQGGRPGDQDARPGGPPGGVYRYQPGRHAGRAELGKHAETGRDHRDAGHRVGGRFRPGRRAGAESPGTERGGSGHLRPSPLRRTAEAGRSHRDFGGRGPCWLKGLSPAWGREKRPGGGKAPILST